MFHIHNVTSFLSLFNRIKSTENIDFHLARLNLIDIIKHGLIIILYKNQNVQQFRIMLI